MIASNEAMVLILFQKFQRFLKKFFIELVLSKVAVAGLNFSNWLLSGTLAKTVVSNTPTT